MVESETMKELRAIKKKLSKEIYGKSWEELQKWMAERKKKREEEFRNIIDDKSDLIPTSVCK